MRPFGTLIDKAVKFREPQVPNPRLERASPPVMNRLDEGVIELFNCACVLNDIDAATDLAALMEKWHGRRCYTDDQQRRVGVIQLKRMHGELERRHIMRGTSREYT